MNDDAWERYGNRVQRVASAFAYPSTPRIDPSRPHAQADGSLSLRRRVLVGAVLAALVCVVSLAVIPEARAGLVRMIQVGAVRLYLNEPPPVPSPATATVTPGTNGVGADLEGWSGETTLEDARARAGFAVLLPTFPPDLGPPDRVFLQDLGGPVVAMAWMTDDDRQIRLLLQEFSPGSWGLKKVNLDRIETTAIHGEPAVWAVGPYLLLTRNGHVIEKRIVDSHALIWDQEGITFRLETPLDLATASQIAESLR